VIERISLKLIVTMLAALSLVLLGGSSALAAGSDEAAGATKFRDLPFSDTTDATAATGNVNDPAACNSGAATNSVWYRIEPKASGVVQLNTFGSNYDTVLSVWKSSPGQSANALTLVTCNDDGPFSLQSAVSFPAERNATYFIMVDPFGSTGAGTLVLNAS